jgi:hydrogenase nickel incorporation protein HypA/HybF
MHEASLMADLLRRIDAIAEAEGARRISGLSVWLGALCHISAQHFAEHFARAAQGTLAEGARLEITVSDDLGHANAVEVRIETLELET